jgi:hypothetical protein
MILYSTHLPSWYSTWGKVSQKYNREGLSSIIQKWYCIQPTTLTYWLSPKLSAYGLKLIDRLEDPVNFVEL